ncbi:MAG: hypothetical protein AB4426_00670 [Xenococcaceae cyanobacterium]
MSLFRDRRFPRSPFSPIVLLLDHHQWLLSSYLFKYDFSDLVGQLTWHGDAVAMQRNLRNEW